MVRETLIFTGRVQGVGFRWTVRRIASRFPVGGWIRNEADGSVRMVVEGEADVIEQLRAEIEAAMAGNIEAVTREQAAALRQFDSFEIRR